MMSKYESLMSFGTTELLIATVVFVVSYLFITFWNNMKKNLPPGPIGLPIVGCLPYLKKDPYLKLQEMAAKYGDVFSMYMGSRFVVVLNGVDAVKEGMNRLEFLGRPPEGPFELGAEVPDITTISGKPFHDQRKFMLHSMRDLGLGKTVLEECMKVELEYFLRAIEDTKGKPWDLRATLSSSAANNITALVYGTRYDSDDPRRKLLAENQAIALEFSAQTSMHGFIPWISKIPLIKHLFGYHRAIKAMHKMYNFSRRQIAEHKKTLDPNNVRDYIDKFLLEMEQAEKKKLPDNSFTDDMLVGNALALMGAGTETVTVTLKWCFFVMAVYQDVQKKVLDEINSVVGTERTPAWSDQRQMPYTQSVITEIMRWKTIVPLNLLRYTFEDTTFRDYDIPKDTIILANLWSAHYDTRYWKEPEKFKPERFLTADGLSVVKSEAFMPFSVGRRSCPGETMAVVELFIYFTTILQRFNISLPKGVIPDLEGIMTISLTPKQYEFCFLSRASK